MVRPERLINEYLSLILEANKNINLTGITSEKDAYLLHVEDSLAALEEFNCAPTGLYVDLGSGAGFPGVPLSIRTGRETLLVDSSKKKMLKVDSILRQLDLYPQIKTCSERIETLAKEMPNGFSVATARALSQLASLLELASPLLEKGGLLICYKAQISPDETKQAQNIESLVGMRLISERKFMLSDGNTHRNILVFEKYDEPQIVLPRRLGMAQKHPLS